MYSEWLFESLQVAKGVLIVDGSRRLEANEVRRTIAQIQRACSDVGIGEGSCVAMLPERSADWVMLLHALLLMGAVPTLIDKKIDPKLIITNETFIIAGGEADVDTLGAMQIIRLDDIMHITRQQGDAALQYVSGKNEDVTVMVVHSSGTTGRPKKVHYSFKNLQWALMAYRTIYQLDINSRILFSLPFHYCYSVIPCCLAPMMHGKTTIILPEGGTNNDVFKLIALERVEIIVATPSLYKDMAKLDPASVQFESLKICDSGGESIPPAVAQLLEDHSSVMVTEGYGLSETTSLTHFLIPEQDGTVRYGSVGRSLSGVDCKIVGESGNAVVVGEIGELCIQGPMVATYEDREILLDDGCFHTGDYFYEDKDSYYYFVSRKKEALDVDPAFAAIVHAAVPGLVLVGGVTDVAYIMYGEDDIEILYSSLNGIVAETYEKEMREHLPGKLSKAAFRHVARIPRNTNGKVLLEKARRVCAE